jgi:hypothetical protein
VFSVGAAPRLYNEDLRHMRYRTEESLSSWQSKILRRDGNENSWQLQQRTGLRVPELAVGRDDGGIERAQLRVQSPAVKRGHYMCLVPQYLE